MIRFFSAQARQLRAIARRPRTGAAFAASLSLTILLALWWQVGRWYQKQLLKEQRSEATIDVSLYSEAVSSAINRRLARLQGLHAFVQTELQEFDVLETPNILPKFETFAADLYAGSKGIRNLAVAPGGVVRYVYPLGGNESILGYEPLNDPRPEIRADAQRAIDSHEIVVSDPIELIQGGLVLIAWQALYQDDDFRGLVNLVVDLPTILDEVELSDEDNVLDLALRDSDGQFFFGSRDVFRDDPVIGRVDLPEGAWELGGVPLEGWEHATQSPLLVYQIPGLLIIGLLVGLTYLSLNRQSSLAAAVQQRTLQLQQDIAKRERVEATLREREAQYREIFESTSDGLFINDLEGRLVDFNPAAAQIHGYSPEEFRQLKPHQYIHADSLPVFSKYIETVKAGDRFRGRATDVGKDGTLFPVEVLGTGFTYRGQPHALAVVRDITEEVRTVRALEEQEALRTQELTTLLVLSNRLVSTLEMAPLMELILEQLKQIVDYTGATVLILEEGQLRAAGHRGPVSPDTVAQLRIPVAAMGEFWDAMLRRDPVIIDDVQAETPQAKNYLQFTRSYPEAARSYVRAWMGIPLTVQERLIGALSVNHSQPSTYTYRHAVLAMAIGNQAAIALENARLYDQARRLAVLEERQRLARELHDSVSQTLYGIAMGASTARALLDRDPAQAAGPLDYVISLTEAGLAEMRALIFELRPDSLEKEGLVAALRKQAAALRARHNLDVQMEFCDEPTLPFEIKEALYRIAQEALNNTIKHARATQVTIRLSDCEGEITLEVQDNGLGFDPQREYPGHLGLKTMQERAAKLGGGLEITSAPGTGTAVRATIPGPE